MNWKQELKTEQSKKVFEKLMDAGADMETVLNILRFTIPEKYQQDKLLEKIEKEQISNPSGMIMAAIEIDEAEHPEFYY